jgi:DNA-binding MarR family transcriptional regulator
VPVDLNHELLRLARTLHVMRTHLATHAPGGVPWSTYALLFPLVTEGPCRARALAETAHVDASTVSRQVDQLVRMGLVERRADPDDGRATQLVATEAGRDLHARVRAARERMIQDLLAEWDPQDVERLAELLGRLNTDMTERLPQLLTTMTSDSTDSTASLSGAGA